MPADALACRQRLGKPSDWLGLGTALLSLLNAFLAGHLKPGGLEPGTAAGAEPPAEKSNLNSPQKGRKTAQKTPRFFPTIFLD